MIEPGARALHDPANEALRTFLTGSVTAAGEATFCAVCGEAAPATRVHPDTKGVAGARPGGASLVSFNAGAFTSHGFLQGENASTCESCSKAYGTALNRLLAWTGDKPPKNALRLSDRTTLVFWTRDDANGAGDTMFEQLLNGSPDQVARLYSAAHCGGLDAEPLDEDRFFAVVLGGDQARIAVRSVLDQTIPETLSNLRRHFDDLEIVGARQPPAIRALLETLAPPGKESQALDPFAGPLVQAALAAPRILARCSAPRVGASAPTENSTVTTARCVPLSSKRCSDARPPQLTEILRPCLTPNEKIRLISADACSPYSIVSKKARTTRRRESSSAIMERREVRPPPFSELSYDEGNPISISSARRIPAPPYIWSDFWGR